MLSSLLLVEKLLTVSLLFTVLSLVSRMYKMYCYFYNKQILLFLEVRTRYFPILDFSNTSYSTFLARSGARVQKIPPPPPGPAWLSRALLYCACPET